MRGPAGLVAVGVLALLVVGALALFAVLAAVRLVFAFIELVGLLILVAVGAFVVWKLFLAPYDPDERDSI